MLLTFEGIDGCGKSTQVRLLVERLVGAGYDPVLIREPGGTDVSERVRALLLDPSVEIAPMAELLLFSAARAQVVVEKIIPALEAGRIVVCDRFYDSTTAYQGAGRRLENVDWLRSFNLHVTSGLVPDRTYYIEVSPEIAFHRRNNRSGSRDRMEEGNRSFFERVAGGYEQLAAVETGRFRTLDGDLPVEELEEKIWNDVADLLDHRSGTQGKANGYSL